MQKVASGVLSGAGANVGEMKRWKTWCLSKVITMTSLTKEARGLFVYSMLDGDALAAAEHLEFAEFAVDGGDTLIFNILEARYLDKDPIDRVGGIAFTDTSMEYLCLHRCGLSDDQRALEASTKLYRLHQL